MVRVFGLSAAKVKKVFGYLYVFDDQMVQGYRGVNINTRDDEESVGEMHMKDYIDVSNQENVAPVYFQSLLLLV